MKKIDGEAVRKGVHDVLADVLSSTGPYPITRAEIISAIEHGVYSAFEEVLDADMLIAAIERGVQDAMASHLEAKDGG